MSEEEKKNLELREYEYLRCSLCNVSYVAMLRLLIKYPKSGHLLLCKTCIAELKGALRNWEYGISEEQWTAQQK